MAFQAHFVVLFLGLVSIVSCGGHTFRLNGCPRVLVMKNFEMDQFLGEWFVVARFNPVASCSAVQIQKTPEDKYTINETNYFFGMKFRSHEMTKNTREITILSNDTDAIFKIRQRFANFGLSTFGVLETDYTTYAFVWGCDPMMVGSVQNLDILSRTPELKPEILKQAREMAEQKKIDIHALEKVDHSHCNLDNDVGTSGINNMFVEP